MSKLNSDSISSFLNDLSLRNLDQYSIVIELRKIILEKSDNINEKIKYGGIVFLEKEDFIGIFTRKKHVSLEFHNGYLLDDKKNYLEGSGKLRRHIKLMTTEDIKAKDVNYFIRQIVDLIELN